MMLEPERMQNRGKQGWPDAAKGTGHKGDKKVDTHTRSTNVSCSLLRLTPQCPHSLVYGPRHVPAKGG